MPVKVYELAKEFKMSNTEMVKALASLGYPRLSPSSDLDGDVETKARATFSVPTEAANGAAPTVSAPSASGDVIEIGENVSIKELAEKLSVSASQIQQILVSKGILAGLNQRLARDAIQFIAQKLGKTVQTASAAPAPETVAPAAVTAPPAPDAGMKPATNGTSAPTVRTGGERKTVSRSVASQGRSSQGMVSRPPVVTIMGHVDHGKTTLLDAIRKSSVASGETGGITQHIGAYQVEVDGKRITFLDTPGHAAFSAMRARGASVTDIIVIVVAADDSIMPQTEEALTLAKESGVPLIIAVNKIDLPDANPDKVLTDLTRYEIVPEAYGGDVQTVNLSAKTGEGLSDLLDTILLVSDAVVEPKADPHGKAQGTVVEAKLEKGRGPVVTVLVQQGTLLLGDVVVAGSYFGKIKGMTDERGSKLTKAGPSTPVEIIGLSAVPDAGDRIEVAKDEKDARAIAARREERMRDERLGGAGKVTLEDLYKTLRQGAIKELNVVIKADVQGSVQAVRDSLLELGNDEVRVRVLFSGVGPIGENDVQLAASDKDHDIKNALVVGFNVGFSAGGEKKAEQEHVTVKMFGIIYELIDAVKVAMVALLDPIYEEAILGKAEIRQLFRLPGGRSIAGSYVTDGLLRRNAKGRVFRGSNLIFTGDIDTLRRFKDDAREVQNGYECGLTLRDFNNIEIGDVIECFEMREVPREL